MMSELIIALIGLVGTVVTGVLTRRKYKGDRRSIELDNVKKGSEILMQQIVTPLKTEMKSLRNELTRFRRAVEQIPACPHSAECPVSRELLADEAGGDDEPADGK